RVAQIVDDEDVADVSFHLGRDVGVALVHVEAMHADSAGPVIADQLRLRRLGHVVDLETAVVIPALLERLEHRQVVLGHAHLRGDFLARGLALERLGQRAPRGRQLLGAAADLAHVALVVDDHDVARDAHLVAVRVVIVERDGGDDARLARIADIDDRGAEMMRIGNVPDIGMRAADRDLPRPGEIEMPQAADVAGEHLAFHCIHRVRSLRSTQSSLAPEALMIAVHFGISDLIYAATPSGAPPMMSTPRSPSDVLMVGSSSAAASARLSVAITSFGVCAGATRPCQVVASKFLIPSSSMVGISGKTAVRLRVATASGRTFPSRIWGTTDEAVANIICTWPAITSRNAGAAPL